MSALESIGAGRSDYAHIAKVATPAVPFVTEQTVLKWYHIAPADAPVPPEIHPLARSCTDDGLVSGQLGCNGDLGFVILHRCGESFYFLIFSTWRNENELWETVWAKNGENDPVFHQWPREGAHAPAFCVWELGAVCHERVAWSEYLRSDRDVAAREAYLANTFAGEV
jgi:hypothetical protein